MSNTTSTKSNAATLTQVQALMAGTMKHFPSGSFTIGSTAYTAASLVQLFQGLVDAMTARKAAEAAAKDALARQQAAQKQVRPILRAYKALVVAAFANTTQTLADFGIAPPKVRATLTTEQRAAQVAKSKATRAARGTTSRKKKLALKGRVTGVTVTPVTDSPAAVPPMGSMSPTVPAIPTLLSVEPAVLTTPSAASMPRIAPPVALAAPAASPVALGPPATATAPAASVAPPVSTVTGTSATVNGAR